MARHKTLHGYFLVSIVALVASACGDDGSSTSGSGGSGGQASGGSAGSAGSNSSGSSGRGGSSGSGGSGVSGSNAGGKGGSGGAGGSAGSAGEAGNGGEAGDGEEPVVLTDAERAIAATLSPLPDVPPDPTNAYADDEGAAALGQMLFFDASYSGALAVDSDLGNAGETGKVSCASCHMSPTMADHRSMPNNVSLGANFHSRNAPGVVNSSYYAWTNWGGRFSSQWELPIAVAEAPVIMNSTRLDVLHTIANKYRAEYDAVFEDLPATLDVAKFPLSGKPGQASWDGMAAEDQELANRVYVNYAKALQAYMRKLVSKNTRFDQFVAGDEDALTPAELRGYKLFVGKARCNGCHLGPNFSDDKFHNIGVPQTGPHVPEGDDGRHKDVLGLLGSPFNGAGAFSDDPAAGQLKLAGLTNPMPESARGAFRTPSLRGVAQSAPYMHSGQLATLEEVVEFYNSGGGVPVSGTKDPLILPLYLSVDEQSDLVAFLKTLNGEPIPPALLEDTSK